MWDNYLEISDAKNFIMMSVGDVMWGITNLLTARGTLLSPSLSFFHLKLTLLPAESRERTRACVAFLGSEDHLRAVNPPISDDHVTNWYYRVRSFTLLPLPLLLHPAFRSVR